MLPTQLQTLISRAENSTLQFKERIEDAYKLGTELVAFSNSKGGMLIIGVNDKTGKINGLSFNELQAATNLLANAASENVKPSIVVFTETVVTEVGNVLVVTVKEGMDKPYKDNKGIVWIKNASDKRKVFANSELAKMMQSCGQLYADRCLIPESSVNDLSIKTVKLFLLKRYAAKCKAEGITLQMMEDVTVEQIVSAIVPGQSLLQLLQNIDLAGNNGELTLAALLLLGKRPQRYRPVFTIKCISFLGNEMTASSFRDKLDDPDMVGNLSHQYETAMQFLKRNLRNIQVEAGFNTLGELEIPNGVLMELLVNALVHRDYFHQSPIRLFIFDNRIEIISPGNLPGSLNEEKIRKGVSVPRNELLFSNANILLPYTGAGSGIRRALELCPQIQFVDDKVREEFIIQIPRTSVAGNLDSDLVSSLDSSLDSDLVSTIINKLIHKDILEETVLILKLLSKRDCKRKDVLEGAIGITNQSFNAKRFLDPLLEMELIKRPDGVSPRSPNLKYQITSKGIVILKQLSNKKE
jgi:ATP-dependent DNA helicase RecG